MNIKKYSNFNNNWEFALDNDLSFKEFSSNSLKWKKVQIPHDWSIYNDFNSKSLSRNEGGLLDGGFGYYKKEFNISEEILSKLVLLKFGGIYMDSSVWINNYFVGNYPYGYSEIIYDITKYLRKGKNQIYIKVEHRQPSSRWYSGSGIYRNIQFIVKDRLSIVENSIKILHKNLDNLENVESNILIEVQNKYEKEKKLNIVNEIIDYEGKIVAKFNKKITIEKNSKKNVEADILLNNPVLWDLENPRLYYLKTSIYSNDELYDCVITRYGYRDIKFDSKEGFFLNGKYLKLHGVCLHHDNGALGAVQDTQSERRKILKLKSMGVNSIRTSHNPQSKEFIRLCDELGMLVIEEAFDTWHGNRKKEYDYNRFFHKISTYPIANGETWAEFDLKNMIKRDINSPSIIMWSIGNEIWETKQYYGIEQAKLLINTIKKIDTTRFVTSGENGFNGGYSESTFTEISDLLDIVGLNYGEDSVKDILRNRPNWKIYGAETSSSVKSRGIFYDPMTKDNMATGNPDKRNRKYQMSDYGNDRVGWGKTAINSWIFDRDNKAYAGQYIWTGFDYIGEPTPWHNEENLGAPSKSSYFGIFDTCGIEKMDYYFYKSQWISKEQAPFVKILPHWNFENKELLKTQGTDLKLENNLVCVRVYSNLQNVELFLNGKSLGKKSFTKKRTDYGYEYLEGEKKDELYLQWIVPFEKGELKAKAFENNYNATDKVITAKSPKTIRLTLDSKAKFGESTFIKFDIVDENQNIVPYAENEVEFETIGCDILGVDNGNPVSHEKYKSENKNKAKRKAFSGSGIIIVRPFQNLITIKANSKGLEETIFELKILDKIIELEDKLNEKLCFGINSEIIQSDDNLIEKSDFIQAQNHSLAVKENSNILFPLESYIYSANGEKKLEKIKEVRKIGECLYEGIINEKLKSNIKVRTSKDTILSYNYALSWNGSEIPAGFASYTNERDEFEDSIFYINNGITSWNPNDKDRWTNISEIHRKNDFVGILFGRAGKLEKHSISKLRIAFFEDDETSIPKEYKIRFYTKDEVSVPKSYSKLEKNHELYDIKNYKEIKIKKLYDDERYVNIEFEEVSTYAIRIDMIASEKNIGISEIEVYNEIAKAYEDFELEILINSKVIEDFDYEIRDHFMTFEKIPKIEVKATKNAAVTIINPNKFNQFVTIIVNDEANMKEKMYRIWIGDENEKI